MLAEISKLLLVEGEYDFHLIKNLLGRHNILATERNKVKEELAIAIQPMGSKNELDKNLSSFLKKGSIQHCGIVLDADQSHSSTYQSCQNFIEKYGQISDWPNLESTGVTTTLLRSSQPPISIGIWIMPNNTQAGMLEHFASEMIPGNDNLWPLAQTTIQNLPEKKFPVSNDADHTRKAELHTWLAWQEEPGKPMGLAVTFGYLQSDTPTALNFVNWIRTVFDIK